MKIYTLTDRELFNFVQESNRIELIDRDPTQTEITAHVTFLEDDATVEALEAFVQTIQPKTAYYPYSKNRLRTEVGSHMNVQVGGHVAPPGGPLIEPSLREMLAMSLSAWKRHCMFESLHPFLDGNGRAGRVLWLHDMVMTGERYIPGWGFLKQFYFQTLGAMR